MNPAYKRFDYALVDAKDNSSAKGNWYNSTTRESVITEVQESMDRNDMRKFYAAVNGRRYKTAPVFTMWKEISNAIVATPELEEQFEYLLNSNTETQTNSRNTLRKGLADAFNDEFK